MLKPDLAIICGERWEQLDLRKAPVPFAPDVAVEVLSPSDPAVGLNRKVHDSLAAGSQEIWIPDVEDIEITVRTKTGIRLLAGG